MTAAPHSTTGQRLLPALGGFLLSLAFLYWARKFIVPLALAVLLAFLLAPLVGWLQRLRLPRLPAVVLVVAAMLALLYGMLRVVFGELNDLARTLPEHSQTITRKVEELRTNQNYIWNQLGQFVNELNQDLLSSRQANDSGKPQPLPVIFQNEAMGALSLFPVVALPLLEVLLTLAFILVLVVYILMRHEDLRDRLLRLAGRGRMALTANALDEAGDRIGRLMLRQLGVNICFGLLFWFGLYWIGVPYAFLWGFLGGLLRFVPYVGTAVALCFPLLLSIAVFPGWWSPLAVLGLFLCLELVIGYVVEPMLFSGSTGASPIALLVAAAFWTWLWGPIGLILSAPLTVCLVVLGRNVPALRFFDILLSSHTVQSQPARYYQQLLAHDRDEATDLLEKRLKEESLETVCDQLLIPALVLVKQDRTHGEIPPSEEEYVLQAMQETFEGSVPLRTSLGEQEEDHHGEKIRLLGCCLPGEGDELALDYFKSLLDARGYVLEIVHPDKISATLADAGGHHETPLLCVVAVAPHGISDLRRRCQRLRSQARGGKILAAVWGRIDNPDRVSEILKAAGASAVTFSVSETCESVKAILSPAREAVGV